MAKTTPHGQKYARFLSTTFLSLPPSVFCLSGSQQDSDSPLLEIKCWENTDDQKAPLNSYNFSLEEMSLEENCYHSELILPNRDFYSGLWLGSLPHGEGKYIWTDGCTYEGNWVHGKITGKGKFSWPSGATYEGEFQAGFMDGTGTYTGAEGESYKGTWCMNLKQGRGCKLYVNGDYYEGEWHEGKLEGHGRYEWKNSNDYVGWWKEGEVHGRGRLRWANGNAFNGEFDEGIPCGKGQFKWADGSRYVGVWCGDGSVKNGVFFPSLEGYVQKDMNEVIMDMVEWRVCEGEHVSILPSQKTVDWSWIESEFLH